MKTRQMISLKVLALALVLAVPARAQDASAPSDAQLTAPGAAATAAVPTLVATTPPTTTSPASATATAAADPCPAPTDAIRSSPDDLAKVQEDIDRYTLCVQRAQLLEQLNESVGKNEKAEDAALGLSQPGVAGAQQNGSYPMPAGMAPLPANALGGADVSPMPPRLAATAPDIATRISAPKNSGDGDSSEKAAEAPKPRESKAWTIREIFGSGNQVQARLVSPEGDEVRAQDGMRLPDGKTSVVRITATGVTVRGEKGAKTLEWASNEQPPTSEEK